MRQLKNYRASGESDVNPAQKYEGMNENELMAELMKNVAAAKSNGTFSAEQLDDFVKFVSPNLDESSRKRLEELVGMIKK